MVFKHVGKKREGHFYFLKLSYKDLFVESSIREINGNISL